MIVRDDKPLYMPPGSVRALLALSVVALVATGNLDEQWLGVVLGAYFVGRASQEQGDERD